ncbi:transglutaminase family protein [Nigerium massiliense]|uniref:transglutaminase family protein n=1 Tax=Nigerium massiliense TaxID=1522317 RepID=UPI00058F739F|nr:transglutaminase family protein [Nigerium massiliense]
MSRLIRIVHTTGYRYEEGATSSFNEARMTPRSTREQLVLSSTVAITPTPWVHRYVDYWGTQVDSFEVHERHTRLNVVATSTVEVERHAADPRRLSWDEMRDRALLDASSEWLEVSARVDPGPELAAIAEDAAARAPSPADCVAPILAAIADRVRYVKGSTDVHAEARTSWNARAGVCQDMVHLMLGALRSVGIPARYVSGYVMPGDRLVVGERCTGESHAWLQYWDGAWIGLDPANEGEAPGESHVEVGVGRDYGDVPPLRGIYTGSGESDMYVEVEMTLVG